MSLAFAAEPPPPDPAPLTADDVVRAELFARLSRHELKLPMLPQIAGQVLAVVGDPSSSAAQLSALIFRDPSLAARVLRVANSAAHGARMPIVSLQQAVARLGTAQVGQIAMAASVQSGVFQVPGYEDELGRLWRHSVAAGLWAKEVARVRRSNVETAFLCGLLHAVGKPTVLQLLVDIARAHNVSPTLEVVRTLIELTHVSVGRLIAEKWELPQQTRAAIASWKTYRQAAAHMQDAMVTCFASALAQHALWPELLDETGLRALRVVADLNLYPDDVSALLAKRAAILGHLEAMTV